MVWKSSVVAAVLATAAPGSACGGQAPAAQLGPCPASPNCISSQVADGRQRIEPYTIAGAPDAAWEKLRRVLAARDDTRITAERPGYLRVEFRTFLGFVDDGEFLMAGDEGVIHLRSASRVGWSDLGKNRRRAEEIRRQFAGSGS